MPNLSSGITIGWLAASAMALAMTAQGAAPAAPSVPPHPLVVATEKVCGKDLTKACEEMLKLTWSSSGLTVDDSIRLLWTGVRQSLAGGDRVAVQNQLLRILRLDPLAQPPPSAPARFGELLEKARAQLPSGAASTAKASRPEDVGTAAGERESEPQALLRAARALYDILEVDGTAIVIDMARSSAPLTTTERAQVSMWLGVLKMEMEEEVSARAMFQEALEADSNVRLPNNVPQQTLRAFLEVKGTAVVLAQPPAEPASSAPPTSSVGTSTPEKNKPPQAGMRPWGLAVGGAGGALVIGGIVAGTMANAAHDATKQASVNGDWDAYVRNRDAMGTAAGVANALYGVGAVALGVGAVLFLRTPVDVQVGAGVGSEKVSIVVGGSF